ncbi:sodium:proton antiporter [Fusobacterium sp. PH5-44]|uniref:sodium:proton antiporter n=1 Tax=unclassified Fusobacterium TaxID=2648384 RepID=UPI003D197513
MITFKLVAGLVVFFLTFYFIIFGKFPKSLVTIIGATLMVLLRILNQEEAIEAFSKNFEIILLLMGMMMVVEVMSESGIFQWLAIKVAQVAKGDPVKILILLSCVTAVCSAFLDNVTTILLIVPIAILLAKKLKINPFPFVIVQIFACNIGGTATMIGDPPNLIIAALGKLSFNDFLIHVAPLAIINLIFAIATSYLLFGKQMEVSHELRASIMDLEPNRSISDKNLMIKSCILFGIVLIGFLTNMISNIGLAVISISAAAFLLLISKKDPEEIYKKIEWETLFFFGGLFIIIDGVEKLGIMELVGHKIIDFTEGNLKLTAYVTVILSSLLSPILGSIPFTLSFGKIIQGIIPTFGTNANILWWALSLGACLGGNMTMIGAPANIVAVSIAEKADIKISFGQFLKYGIIMVLESVIISLLYIYIRY